MMSCLLHTCPANDIKVKVVLGGSQFGCLIASTFIWQMIYKTLDLSHPDVALIFQEVNVMLFVISFTFFAYIAFLEDNFPSWCYFFVTSSHVHDFLQRNEKARKRATAFALLFYNGPDVLSFIIYAPLRSKMESLHETQNGCFTFASASWTSSASCSSPTSATPPSAWRDTCASCS